ncbi:MAG TPA: hypothetical protein VJN71_07090 [Nitrososphaerales archaeon]|nr:hypothetical protein [Nitrososphaerales archaeon]
MAGKPAQNPNTPRETRHHDNSLPETPENLELDDVAVTLALSNSALRALSFFGSKRIVDSVLDILELEHSISINDVSRRPEVFENGIEAMFGSGSSVILKILRREIAKDLGVLPEGRTLDQLVEFAREKQKSEIKQTSIAKEELVLEK